MSKRSFFGFMFRSPKPEQHRCSTCNAVIVPRAGDTLPLQWRWYHAPLQEGEQGRWSCRTTQCFTVTFANLNGNQLAEWTDK